MELQGTEKNLFKAGIANIILSYSFHHDIFSVP